MTKEDLDRIIKENRFSRIGVYGDDEIENLIEKIYYDGMADGYEIAIFRLQMLGSRMPYGSSRDYLKKNSSRIKTILSAIQEYEQDTVHQEEHD